MREVRICYFQGMEGEQTPGLRERKKLRTRETIVRVALELFGQQGYQATTIPQIAEAADISPRTVSTYFPLKEGIVFEPWAGEKESFELALADRDPGQSTIDALRAWLLAQRGIWEEREQEMRLLHRVIDSDESLRAIEHVHHHELQQLLGEGIARDMDLETEDMEPRIAAAATVAAFDVINQERLDHASGGKHLPLARGMEIMDRALAFVDGGVEALRHRSQD